MTKISVNIRLIRDEKDQTLKIEKQSKIVDLLAKLDKNPEAVITKRNGLIVTEKEQLSDGDDIEIIPIVSGG